MAVIFTDENHTCQFDFTHAVWATDQLHTIYQAAKTPLSDADFIVETEDQLLFIEYKNAAHPGTEHPEAFQPKSDSLMNKLAHKYYDSQHYCYGTGKNQKEKIYIVILEYPESDSVTNKWIRNQLVNRLPFSLQVRERFQQKLISQVEVLSVTQWNEKYKEFPLTLLP